MQTLLLDAIEFINCQKSSCLYIFLFVNRVAIECNYGVYASNRKGQVVKPMVNYLLDCGL